MFRVLFNAVVIILSLSQAALANPENVAPSDWQRSEKGELTVYQSPSKQEVMVFRTVDRVIDPKRAVAMISKGVTDSADRILFEKTYVENNLTITDTLYQKRGIEMHIRVFGVRRTDGVFQAMAHMAPMSESGFKDRLKTSAERMSALGGVVPKAVEPKKTSPVQDAALSTSKISAIVFELSYRFGVGGVSYPVYEPVIIYQDGVAVKPGSTAIDDIIIANFQKRSPKSFGRWRRVGTKYEVTWTGKTKTNTLDPKIGPPKPLPQNHELTGRYQMLSGGGNIAFGGGTMTVQAKTIVFDSSGEFYFSDKQSVSSGAGVGGTQSAQSGHWSLDGPTLILKFKSGETVRTPLFYSASRKQSADFGKYGVLWIGGKNYRRIG